MNSRSVLRKPAQDKSERLQNHMAAPKCAAFVAEMRHTFGKIEVLSVEENEVSIGIPSKTKDPLIVSYAVTRQIKDKRGRESTESLPPIEYMIASEA